MSSVCDIVGPFPPPNSPGTLQTMHDAMVANRIETVDYFRSTQNYRLNTLITLRLSLCRTELFTVASILLHFVSCTKTNCLEKLRHFGTGPEVSRHFGTIRLVPKCLGNQNVLVPKCFITTKRSKIHVAVSQISHEMFKQFIM